MFTVSLVTPRYDQSTDAYLGNLTTSVAKFDQAETAIAYAQTMNELFTDPGDFDSGYYEIFFVTPSGKAYRFVHLERVSSYYTGTGSWTAVPF